jgi:hypothetical protein
MRGFVRIKRGHQIVKAFVVADVSARTCNPALEQQIAVPAVKQHRS